MAAFDSNPQKISKLRIAIGESNETEFWLDLCRDTGELQKNKTDEYKAQNIEIRKMLIGLLKSINK